MKIKLNRKFIFSALVLLVAAVSFAHVSVGAAAD
jgi:hypothetical protein